MSKYPYLKIEDCGKFFDSYVLYENKNTYYIKDYAKQLPLNILIKCKKSPEHAKAILEIYGDIDKKYVDNIIKTGNITNNQYNYIIKKLNK